MSKHELAAYLSANPSMTTRDFKGKGFDIFHPFDKHHVEPGEVPWHKLDPEQARIAATSDKARFLSKNLRQAAGRDPGLIWDERTGAYRRRQAAPPAPPLANSDQAGGGGAHESFHRPTSKTGACHEFKFNDVNSIGDA